MLDFWNPTIWKSLAVFLSFYNLVSHYVKCMLIFKHKRILV